MQPIWLVVADASQARIYEKNKAHLKLIKTFNHSESRLKNHELRTDKMSPYRASTNSYGSHADINLPKEVEKLNFAKQVVSFLEKARSLHRYQKLVWISLAHFYGLAAKKMSKQLSNLVFQHIDKNYVSMKEQQLESVVNSQGLLHWKI